MIDPRLAARMFIDFIIFLRKQIKQPA